MTESSVVRARIDEATKREAAAVLAGMGLSLSDAFRLLLKRGAAEGALPFEPLVPNAETIAAMREARGGGLPRFRTQAAAWASRFAQRAGLMIYGCARVPTDGRSAEVRVRAFSKAGCREVFREVARAVTRLERLPCRVLALC